LPVLCTQTCGYSVHIDGARAGIVLPSPFSQDICNRALVEMLTSEQIPLWRANGLAYASRKDLYSCHERAAEIIEETVRRKLVAIDRIEG
jgi:UDP-glucose:(heptosyl)LPS alpha-1,3-glucosyltransferase